MRWVYDKSTSLSFLREKGKDTFLLGLPKTIPQAMNISGLDKGETYYGTLEKRDGTTIELVATAQSDRALILTPVSPTHSVKQLKTMEKVYLFFENTIINLPLVNAVENFGAYQQCLNSLNPDQPAPQIQKPREQDLNALATQHLKSNRKGLAAPPPVAGFKKSNTHADVLEQYKKSENSYDSQRVNENLIKKLKILEDEKEALRKKLLYLTQDQYLAGLVACEPASGGN